MKGFPGRAPWRCAVAMAAVALAYHAAAAAAPGVDPAQAKQAFAEAARICQADGGKLWGKSLCGPMLFADPKTRSVVANQADAEGRLRAQDGVFVGELPAEVNIANTATTWAGVHWTMIRWPLPTVPTARDRLMMHELFHRIQDDLGLPALSPANAHLGTLEGRVWLRLEWRALQQALARADAPPAARRRAVEDALLFRRQRRALFPKAAEEERGLELNEGMAEYTGYKLRGTADAATVAAVMGRLGDADSDSNFSRSFAYVSGPAYGLLLDLSGVAWRKRLAKTADLGDLLRQAYGVTLPPDPSAAAQRRAEIYDGGALRWVETEQEQQRQATIADYRRRLVEGPVLTFPVADKFNFSFDPNDVVPIDETASAYGTLRVTDSWGVLEAGNGALLVREQDKFVRVAVEAPKDSGVKAGEIAGNGWKLTLAAGWTLVPGERPGDLRVERAK